MSLLPNRNTSNKIELEPKNVSAFIKSSPKKATKQTNYSYQSNITEEPVLASYTELGYFSSLKYLFSNLYINITATLFFIFLFIYLTDSSDGVVGVLTLLISSLLLALGYYFSQHVAFCYYQFEKTNQKLTLFDRSNNFSNAIVKAFASPKSSVLILLTNFFGFLLLAWLFLDSFVKLSSVTDVSTLDLIFTFIKVFIIFVFVALFILALTTYNIYKKFTTSSQVSVTKFIVFVLDNIVKILVNFLSFMLIFVLFAVLYLLGFVSIFATLLLVSLFLYLFINSTLIVLVRKCDQYCIATEAHHG